jgi:predicted DNA-binding transcriptional regulator AlpA
MDHLPKALSSKQAAEVIGIAPESLCRMRSQGRGPAYVRDGQFVRYSPAAIEQWLTSGHVERRRGGNRNGARG